MTGDDILLVERRAAQLWLTLNRPAQRNALSLALLRRLDIVLAGAAGDPELRCVVITGSGKCFAAGGDLRELESVRTTEQALEMSRLGRAALDRVRHCPVPVIAGLNGHALGGGAELAMACDLRIASPSADLGFLQAQLNLTPAWGGGIDLIAAVGPGRAAELLVSARRVTAPEAQALGLVQQLGAEGSGWEDSLADFASAVAARPPQVLRAVKAVNQAARLALHERLRAIEEARFVETWVHDDHWAAAAAALAPRNGR